MKDSFLYFSDTPAGVIELGNPFSMLRAEFTKRFPGVRGLSDGGTLSRLVACARGSKDVYPVTRCIRYKKFPSLHVCNAKCMGGKINGTCECQCGGKNHGRAAFTVAAQ